MSLRKSRWGILAGAMGIAAIVALTTPAMAQRTPQDAGKVAPPAEGESGGGLAVDRPDLAGNPVLLQAAALQPISPRLLEDKFPAEIAGMKRLKLGGKRTNFGPAAVTVVGATYYNDEGMIMVKLVDPGGMPLTGDKYLPILSPGVTEDTDKSTRRGVAIDGYPATQEDFTKTAYRDRLQVAVGSRIRLLIEYQDGRAEDAMAATGAFDLEAIAKLAPEPQPVLDMSVLEEK